MAQILRTGLDTAATQPFALTALARGASPHHLTRHHLMRHGFAATLTITGYIVGTLIGGAVIVETIFARGGIGRVTLDAISGRDLPVIMGVVILSGVAFIAINTMVDIIARIVDPRLRARSANA